MKQIQLGTSQVQTGEVGLGCMRMDSLSAKDARHVIDTALDVGITLFDHADIYGKGNSERVFASAIKDTPSLREKMIVQSKCGIRKGFFDFSKEHIITSVEESLKRLEMDYLDVLLLHRPDALMEPEEVAEAFTRLKEDGKVAYFGVSNQHPGQMELLKAYVREPLLINQVQLSVMHTPMIDASFNVNMYNREAINRDLGIMEYSRLHNMTIQAWSPFQYGMIEGTFMGNEDFPNLNKTLQELADKKGVTDSAIAIAWLLRLPLSVQPIVGTMNTSRLKDISKASEVELTREEWYELYRSAGNELP
ncbi:aldo/keto reductase [Paenalkalicoccus suaedae]|uniref:Aldo/keto reductase n=1 Tax=Paenalkalicoccus suaedae TaxID=2592382 RepID=A0A859FF52_9BACI|nr:aldo/keto reductase [Paenalkalicoccus suaedae]QKS71601.1 aldo/keto reductase [Paenalkalicoccus suaedae]